MTPPFHLAGLLAGVLAGCQTAQDQDLAPVDVATDPAATETSPSDDPYIAEEDPVEPALTLDQVSTAVSAALANAKTIRGSTLFDAYAQILESRDADCPYTDPVYSEYYGIDYWYDSCTSGDGTEFNGYGYGYIYLPFVSGTYYYNAYDYLYGDAEVTSPDGSRFVASGYAGYYDYDEHYYYNYRILSFYSFGEFQYDGPGSEGTWLEDGLSSTLSVTAYAYDSGAEWLYFDGGISRLSGEINAYVFDQFNAGNTAYGQPCPEEPGGSLSLRDSTGDWYDVYFDGAQYGATTVFPPDCDACGHVWFRGAYIGDVCPDFDGLLNWENWTW